MSNLVMAIDHLGRQIRSHKPFNLEMPLQTKLNFLKVSDTEQEQNLQDECPHTSFDSRGECMDCNWKCEHFEIDESVCLDCGKFIKPEIDEDMIFERERERRMGL